jgi:hypothetical protein
MRILSVIGAAGAVFAAATVGFAQSQAPAPPASAPLQAPECQRGALPTPGESTGSVTLSDQTVGIKGRHLSPAGIDPGIAAPPVGGGRTPVIPPPGTPGGDPSIVPK